MSDERSIHELRRDVSGLTTKFYEWREANQEDRKGIYHRLNELEEKARYIPNEEESELIKEASLFYKTKREFRERMYQALIEKGLTGVIIFIVAAVLFYLRHILSEGG